LCSSRHSDSIVPVNGFAITQQSWAYLFSATVIPAERTRAVIDRHECRRRSRGNAAAHCYSCPDCRATSCRTAKAIFQ
ncbi:hypothetical protein ANCCAN_16766, partial [Ancylostoma caninum]